MPRKLTTEESGEIFRAFIDCMRFVYSDILSDLQARLKQFIGEELTDIELKTFKEEFEHAVANIGFMLLISKLSETVDIQNQDVFLGAYLLTMYTSPLCGERVSGIDSQHSKDFHNGFIRYNKLGDLKLMIDEICERTQNADSSDDFLVTSGRSVRKTGLRILLTGVIPLIFNSLKDFLDDTLKQLK